MSLEEKMNCNEAIVFTDIVDIEELEGKIAPDSGSIPITLD
jgi:hypothetical protein